MAVPTAAHAHVEISPDTVEGGDWSVVAVRVPNERDDASTVQLRLLLPADRPLASVSTAAIPGWRVSTRTRTLAAPLDTGGEQVDSVVSEVTWRATSGGVRPGQYQDFPLDLGRLPESGRLVFTAVQTYSDGERVTWNEVPASGAAEPEHPAPVLAVTAPSETSSTHSRSEATSDTATKPTSAVERASSSTAGDRTGAGTTAIVTASVALLLAAAAVALSGLSWRRARR